MEDGEGGLPYRRRLMAVVGYGGDGGDGPSNVDDDDDGHSSDADCLVCDAEPIQNVHDGDGWRKSGSRTVQSGIKNHVRARLFSLANRPLGQPLGPKSRCEKPPAELAGSPIRGASWKDST